MIQPPRELTGVDRRIWTEELDAFVPNHVFDIHTHCYRWAFNINRPEEGDSDFIGRDFPEAGRAELDAWDAVLLPGRQVRRLSFGYPFMPAGDFEASNAYVAEQIGNGDGSASLMLVNPAMSPEYLESQIATQGFCGFKPYFFYTRTGDLKECRITDFFPEEQIEVADRLGLIVMLHLGKRLAISDPDNIEDVLRLTCKYGNIKWILAHCARSYAPWVIEKPAKMLRGLPNVWYDVSSVCDPDVIEILMSEVGPDRVMYGSDDLPVGAARGKYITFGYAWAFLSEDNHSLGLSHCNPDMTYVRYEQLRAMRRAANRLRLDRSQVEDLFCNTAVKLVQSTSGKIR
jgi:glutamate-1-semialdehyde 2,1-aminomutase